MLIGIEGSITSSTTNMYPIVDILSFTSVEIIFNLLSNVHLLGMDTNPQGQC
ncbi:MAG TPA: hypothetical protein VN704_09975 [Verrucomicrobiae bacterium]|nr:hypothetical protein [Verrucomicrobiae bacterium]